MGQKISFSAVEPDVVGSSYGPTHNSKNNNGNKTLPNKSKSSTISNLAHSTWKRKTYRKVLILSLDAAGKTSILYWFKHKTLVPTIPTIGYNHETLAYKTTTFDFWDVGGQDGIREMWSNYFFNVQAVIFVVDSSDRERIDEARTVLRDVERLIQESENPKRSNVVVLILANKQDLPNAMSVDEIHQNLQLQSFNALRWHVLTCCTKTGDGLKDALNWLHWELKKRF